MHLGNRTRRKIYPEYTWLSGNSRVVDKCASSSKDILSASPLSHHQRLIPKLAKRRNSSQEESLPFKRRRMGTSLYQGPSHEASHHHSPHKQHHQNTAARCASGNGAMASKKHSRCKPKKSPALVGKGKSTAPLSRTSRDASPNYWSPLMPTITVAIISHQNNGLLCDFEKRFVSAIDSESDRDVGECNVKQIFLSHLGGAHKLVWKHIDVSKTRDHQVYNQLHDFHFFVMLYNRNDWKSFAKSTKYLRRIDSMGVAKGVLLGINQEANNPLATELDAWSFPTRTPCPSPMKESGSSCDSCVEGDYEVDNHETQKELQEEPQSPVTPPSDSMHGMARKFVTTAHVENMRRKYPHTLVDCLRLDLMNASASVCSSRKSSCTSLCDMGSARTSGYMMDEIRLKETVKRTLDYALSTFTEFIETNQSEGDVNDAIVECKEHPSVTGEQSPQMIPHPSFELRPVPVKTRRKRFFGLLSMLCLC